MNVSAKFEVRIALPVPEIIATAVWTDRQTDGRTTGNRNTALCTIVRRAVIITKTQ